MNIIKVTTKAQLDELYKDWSLTIEGLAPDEENLKQLLDWVKELTPLKGRAVRSPLAGAMKTRGAASASIAGHRSRLQAVTLPSWRRDRFFRLRPAAGARTESLSHRPTYYRNSSNDCKRDSA